MKKNKLRLEHTYEKIKTVKIKIIDVNDNAFVIYKTRQLISTAGFSVTDEMLISTAASELATNIIRYGDKGHIEISTIQSIETDQFGVEIYAVDEGPGIRNIELAMKEKYSSSPSSLGLGLPSVKRIMDEFIIESIVGEGTCILACKWLKNEIS